MRRLPRRVSLPGPRPCGEKKRLSSSQMATMEAPTSGKQIPSTTSTAMAPPMGGSLAGRGRGGEATTGTAAPPEPEPASTELARNHQADEQHDELVRPAVELAHVQHDAGFPPSWRPRPYPANARRPAPCRCIGRCRVASLWGSSAKMAMVSRRRFHRPGVMLQPGLTPACWRCRPPVAAECNGWP